MATDQQIQAALEAGKSGRSIIRDLGVGYRRIARVRKQLSGEISFKGCGEDGDLSGDGFRIAGNVAEASLSATIPITEEDLTRHFNIDTSQWQCEEFKVRSWETSRANRKADLEFDDGRITGTVLDHGEMTKCPMYSSWGKFTRRKDAHDRDLAAAFKKMLGTPRLRRAAKPSKALSSDIGELALPDVHFGLRSYVDETGQRYDIQTCRDNLLSVVDELLDGFRDDPVQRLIVPIGHDWLNSDNAAGTTTGGTPQDEDGHFFSTFQVATQAAVEVIDKCREVAKEVEVILIPGNHDGERSYYVVECLQYAFAKCDDVIIDVGLSQIKARLHHECLIGYQHGHGTTMARLATALPVLYPELWAKSKWREWHLGHIHHEVEKDMEGVRVRYFRCLTALSAWAASKGYTGSLRAATSIRYGKSRGPYRIEYAYI